MYIYIHTYISYVMYVMLYIIYIHIMIIACNHKTYGVHRLTVKDGTYGTNYLDMLGTLPCTALRCFTGLTGAAGADFAWMWKAHGFSVEN